ncbi:ABC transporter substrate-binding protein [Dactylosporangium sp. CA-152071]|uniref:ABC transporter substrate-binding protein n=1 Tax=Dactylosporangium sp. CA-152071 TaxID=3239933 RepID=UPI003D91C04E
MLGVRLPRLAGRTGAAVATALAVALSLSACGSDPQSSKSDGTGGPTTVRVGITSSINNATMNLAIDGKLGDAHGISLRRQNIAGAGSTNQVAALLAGDVDVAVGGTNTVIDAIAKGADVQIIAGMAPLLFSLTMRNEAAQKTGVAPDAPIENRLKALKGLRIAVSPSGSTGNIVLRTILEGVGLKPDTDVRFVPLNDLGAIPAGLIQGTFDASFAAVGSGEVAVAQGKAVTWVSLPKGDVTSLKDYQGIVTYASRSYIEKNPDTVKAVHDALNDGQKMTVDQPDKAAELLKSNVFKEMDKAVFDNMWAQCKSAYPAGSNFTEVNWKTLVTLFDATSENDYAALKYDKLVAPVARGN